jgi:hypothetical protein
MKTTGTREEVFNGTAIQTSGKLTKSDLMLNASGSIVSRKQSESAQKRYPAMLEALCRKHGHCGDKRSTQTLRGSDIATVALSRATIKDKQTASTGYAKASKSIPSSSVGLASSQKIPKLSAKKIASATYDQLYAKWEELNDMYAKMPKNPEMDKQILMLEDAMDGMR